MISNEYLNITDICANSVLDRMEAFHQYASINMNGRIKFRHKIGLGLQFKSGLIYFLQREQPDLQLWHIPSTLSIGYENNQIYMEYFIHLRLEYTYQDYRYSKTSAIIGLKTDIKWGSLRPGAYVGLSYYQGYRILNLGFQLSYPSKN